MKDHDPPTFDPAVLEDVGRSVGDDTAFVTELVATYLGDGADQLVAIREAVSAGDAAGLVRPAHTLKTSSRTVGALRLGEICRALEETGRSGALGGAAELAADASDEWTGVQAALSGWITGLQG